jgi:hypothetical protein
MRIVYVLHFLLSIVGGRTLVGNCFFIFYFPLLLICIAPPTTVRSCKYGWVWYVPKYNHVCVLFFIFCWRGGRGGFCGLVWSTMNERHTTCTVHIRRLSNSLCWWITIQSSGKKIQKPLAPAYRTPSMSSLLYLNSSRRIRRR